jgi:hypothetical protein
LQEGDAAQTGLAVAAFLATTTLIAATALVATTTLVPTTALIAATALVPTTTLIATGAFLTTTLPLVLLRAIVLLLRVVLLLGLLGRVTVGTVGLRFAGLALLLRIAGLLLLAFLAIAPTQVVAMGEATHGLDDAVVVVGVLPVGLGHDAVARGSRLAGQRLVFVEHLVGVAADTHVRPAAIEDLVPIGRAVRIVVTAAVLLLVMLVTTATAAAIAAATRPLPIVWSH